MQVTQQSLFDSQAHVIQVHKYCTKWETFRFALPAWNLFTRENESRALSQLSAGQVFGKIRVLAKSRNRCKFIQVLLLCMVLYIFIHFQACYGACLPSETSISFKLKW